MKARAQRTSSTKKPGWQSVVFQHASRAFIRTSNGQSQPRISPFAIAGKARRETADSPISFSYRSGHFFHLSHADDRL